MSKQTSTGVTLSVVDDLPTTFDDTGYAALAWVEVGEVIDLPAYGPEVTVVESQPLATGITEKRSGFINFGSMALGLEWDLEDAGQAVLAAAIVPGGAFVPHSFKIEYANGVIEYFHGGIFSYTRAPGSANSMVGSTVNVEINSEVISVLPTP